MPRLSARAILGLGVVIGCVDEPSSGAETTGGSETSTSTSGDGDNSGDGDGDNSGDGDGDGDNSGDGDGDGDGDNPGDGDGDNSGDGDGDNPGDGDGDNPGDGDGDNPGDGDGDNPGDGDGDPGVEPCAPAPWASELVYQGNIFTQLDAAVDELDRLHVVYRAPGIGTRWARRDEMDWLEETIPSPNDCDGNPAVVVDPQLGVHVVFEGKSGECEGGARLDYAHRPVNGDWTIEASEQGLPGEYVAWTSVVLDDAGQVFSSYYHRNLISPRVAIRDSNGDWTIETASAQGGSGKANSIALDGEGGVHVVFRREGDLGLYYSYRDPNEQSWTEELIAAGAFSNGVGQSSKIEVDALGDVHVFTEASGGPRYLYRAAEADAWDSEVVDDAPLFGRYATMDLDADGGIHVAYQNSGAGTLRYGYRAPEAVDWNLEEIAIGGARARIVVAPSGLVHIVHAPEGEIERWYACPAD